MNELDALTFLLEQDYGFDQYGLVRAYKTDAWNFFKDGVYAGGKPKDDGSPPVEGAEQCSFLVNWGDPIHDDLEEKAFPTAREAAEFFIQKRKELGV